MVVDENKQEVRNKLSKLDDIYSLKELLIQTTKRVAQ
jgi:hypothetical protein